MIAFTTWAKHHFKKMPMKYIGKGDDWKNKTNTFTPSTLKFLEVLTDLTVSLAVAKVTNQSKN